MVNDKPTWTLVAHAGTVAHSHLMVSLVQAHYINQGIRENKKLSVNVVDESWLAKADKMGTISGSKVDKSEEYRFGIRDEAASCGFLLIGAAIMLLVCSTIYGFLIGTLIAVCGNFVMLLMKYKGVWAK